MSKSILIALALTSVIQMNAQSKNEPENGSLKLRGVAELGFVGVVDHRIQFSNSGTYFDYKRQGGQDVLFPVSRLSLELEHNKKNTYYLLYQPLRLESQVLLKNDLVVDDLVFQANTSVKLLYNFPFYRFSYSRELLSNNDRFDLGIGASLQIRNATISFESSDGSLFRTNRDVGPVPVLKIRTAAQWTDRFYTEIEADGIYAPISYLNGSDNEVVGAILDGSVRAGWKMNNPASVYLNARYIGGGAVGTSDVNDPGDGYVRNWLHFVTITAGFVYEFDMSESE